MQCRVCLQSNCNSLIEMDLLVSDEGETLYDCFNACTRLCASANDGLPNTLCKKCTKKLEIAFDFRKCALLSNEEFKRILKLANTKTESLQLVNANDLEEHTSDPLEMEPSESIEIVKQHKVLGETSLDTWELVPEDSYNAEIILEDLRPEDETTSDMQPDDIMQDNSCNTDNEDDLISEVFNSDSNVTAPYQCEYCSDEFSTDGELHDHVKKHIFKCQFCPKICINMSYYEKHLNRLHSSNASAEPILVEGAEINKDKRIVCTLCNMTYSTLGAYRRHAVKTHDFDFTKKDTNKDGVNDIQKDYTVKTNNYFLQEEISQGGVEINDCITKIQKKKNYLCSFCPRVLLSKGGLAQHEAKQHLKIEPDLNQCPFCGKTFKRDYLGKHMDVVHNEVRKFKCNICGRMFKTQHVAARHRLLHNSKDHNFSCSVCNKRFTEKSALNVHMRLHTGEMPFSCNICEKRFRIRGHLTYHLKLHVNAKHKCDICDKEFKHPKSLQNHLYVHSGLMPYTCTICEYGNVKREYFTKHMLQKHNKEMTPEELFEMYKSNTGRPLYAKIIERID
ncbi:zinc finger and SCAN domain-containing protein 12 isoform X2 [Ceratitis capitata]|uniref:zinc finger and SCAN domain-containing protein 12 isoform X2 n=1 Tax=Ceratitis capitata TaxID=7213 RepID=UPI0006188F76|nr:zinc finger and SCAN domain-containing protein 12 isoform X2 [Ceratitis capitata]